MDENHLWEDDLGLDCSCLDHQSDVFRLEGPESRLVTASSCS